MRFVIIFCVMTRICYSLIPERVVICGVCKNVEIPLPYTIEIMEQIGSLFEDYRIVVYENNSTDKTVSVLEQWQRANPKVYVKSEHVKDCDLDREIVNYKEDGTFFHPETIARARNIVLDIVMSDQYREFPYVIWMDMDFKIPPAFEGIIEVFQSDREWDAVFAYGVDPSGAYWDWYAFRNEKYPIGSELLGNYWWYMDKSFSLRREEAWYPVYSAFGGCGIYKKSSIVGCRYSGIVTKDLETVARKVIDQHPEHPQILNYLKKNSQLHSLKTIPQPKPHLPKIQSSKVGIILHKDESDPVIWRMNFFVSQYPSVCEHVAFHASMIAHGHGKLFINPRLVFTYGELSVSNLGSSLP